MANDGFGHAAEDEAAEPAAAVGGHNDEVDVVFFGVLHNGFGHHVALDCVDGNPGPFLTQTLGDLVEIGEGFVQQFLGIRQGNCHVDIGGSKG